jgi:hypothetical protein
LRAQKREKERRGDKEKVRREIEKGERGEIEKGGEEKEDRAGRSEMVGRGGRGGRVSREVGPREQAASSFRLLPGARGGARAEPARRE